MSEKDLRYDVLVVGGGHAGCEAAHAAATMGSSVLLITMNLALMGQMSCNPAMGGIAKGQIVREIDALGGMSGLVADRSTLQFRMLNRSKGPAMWSPRTQNDRMRFAEDWRLTLEKNKRIAFWQDTVQELVLRGGQVCGVKTGLGLTFQARAVVLTNGTFLNGVIHIGRKTFHGGRIGERAAYGLTEQLVAAGFETGRMKTGTPPRLDGRTIRYEETEEQKGDASPGTFSFLSSQKPVRKQRSCYIAYTNAAVHAELKKGFKDSPMFNGRLQGVGPRYCPSVEDKIHRFADKDRHQLFLEPEGWKTVEVYVNGFSTSLPEAVQLRALREVRGLEDVRFFRPGYAIAYDYFMPTQLFPTLETKRIGGLYFAGQINGTTGYEEAACQGLMAGVNAHRKVQGLSPFTLKRSEAYIGVLIDDLIHKGTDEPYRMFTSRAEFRLTLRQDNADLRLSEQGAAMGLASAGRGRAARRKKEALGRLLGEVLKGYRCAPEEVNEVLVRAGASPIRERVLLAQLLCRPEVDMASLQAGSARLAEALAPFAREVWVQAEIAIKYAEYIVRAEKMAAKIEALEGMAIGTGFDYQRLCALSAEGREKLEKLRPRTLGQASRISGVSASDLSILAVYMRK